ncbi:MAG TPA: hypothetical protein VKT29_14520 [Terriglobales bacterium]|nr:hypothetical protein [Terriglobales bacterium]
MRDNGLSVNPCRRYLICLAVLALLLGGIRLHALQFSAATTSAVSADHDPHTKRQSFDSDASYCVAPPRIFAFEPAPAVFSRVVLVHDVFLPAHPDGWYFNRPPPLF